MKCTDCHETLTGGLDTFGLHNEPLCWRCYAERVGEGGESVYGLGPHTHEFDPETGVIKTILGDQSPTDEFMPDPDAPGLGVWISEVPPGWR